ncbi:MULTISPECIES: CFI-box-CTERM domain-containing protein [Gammaproteobacteria]|uniref:CFI-box-CTERM domain-containing protein n=1 Tax=Gammaproteobacteria TaxID=1236 RepID=UPI000DCF953D|nr:MULTISPECIES: CFI-box-CTERM domain-containing protein [Gammaproteobacteria]RTE85517.1 hypothetical protein DQX04_11480 [Aliidiomarina sp. B3213]TCZ89487.1 hypothetical protein EYQ95_11410 [Lysobacter sp. N42]
MDIVHENPFRVLGLFANSSERDLQKQVAKLKRFLEVGKSVDFQTDYSLLNSVDRSPEIILQATALLEQNYEKLHHALFWFVVDTPFDEIAHSKLADNEIDSAIDIWRTRLKAEVTEANLSSYLNLSTLLLALSVDDGHVDKEKLAEGLNLKGRLLQSQALSKLPSLLHIKSEYLNTERLTAEFVDETVSWLNNLTGNPNGIEKFELIKLFTEFPSDIQRKVLDEQVKEPIRDIQSQIERCEDERKQTPLKADRLGKKLFNNTKDRLSTISSMVNSGNLKYQLLVNSLADEIIECSISYFNSQSKNGNPDAHKKALGVLELAHKLSPSGQTNNRLEDSRQTLEKMMQEREEEREQEELLRDVEPYVARLTKELEAFNSKSSINAVSDFIQACRPELDAIRAEIGDDNDAYIMLSDGIVNCALNALIEVVNGAQQNARSYGLDKMLKIVTQARNLTKQLASISCSPDMASRVKVNLRTISSIVLDLEAIKRKNSGGCYIATMAYGSYDHPKVKALRRYRDNVLKASFTGRLFIKIYYAVSPHLVSRLAGHPIINEKIRGILDKLIKVIEK